MTDARVAAVDLFRALPHGAKGFALLLSVSAHALMVLAVAHGPRRSVSSMYPAQAALIEIATLDLALAEAPAHVVPTQTAVAAPHKHSYPVSPDHDLTPHDPSLRHDQPASSDGAAPLAATPTVIDSPSPTWPRFAMTVGVATRALGGATAADGRNEIPGSNAAGEPVPEASVDTPAQLLVGTSVSYTPEAQAAGIEADVPLEIVVDGSGAVISARVLSHVGYGLDEAALRGVRAYRFSAARRAGKALAVRMHWVVRFQLR
jgi:protein TonB